MNKTKKSLLFSVVSLLLCLSMLLGTTYAWFTDSVATNGNKIVSGSLRVDLLHHAGDSWVSLKKNPEHKIFDYDRWEPGFTRFEKLKVQNLGKLALKYQLSASIAAGTEILGAAGENLADVIEVYYYNGESNAASFADIKADSAWTLAGTLKDMLNAQGGFASGNLLPSGQTPTANAAAGERTLSVALHMQESAGNEYQNLSLGDMYITLLATQYTHENDSFGSDYDKHAIFPDGKINYTLSAGVNVGSDNKTTADVVFANSQDGVIATLPAGAVVEEGTSQLTLTITELVSTDANITVADGQGSRSLDVHIAGLSKNNATPVIVTLDKFLRPGMNMGNYTLYHVENDAPVAMTYVTDTAALDAHNEFTYDPATGSVKVALASFSEVAGVVDEISAWEGDYDYTWYDADAEELVIANADQLAGFGRVVGGMAEGIARDSFAGQTVKLVADIDLGDKNNKNETLIFHPIGYVYTDDNNGDGVKGDYYSSVKSFVGTFDGNGHTISNFYQNTWEIKGDYDGNYYSDAMGLFGYVYGGTVKNLTVDSFSSDGEFTPTGVIAAYVANGATFSNIAITNCNPRVYNTGNGGIVGILGNDGDDGSLVYNFDNITVDNSNKITALWGSYDVACGGIAGMYRGRGNVRFNNCHVAAQMDVNNDVCGNYQYYQYRYAGMMIGSTRIHTTDAQGRTIPDLSTVSATDCTVHFGGWNAYYYCELVANSLASYTHDHQFSRLTQVKSVDANTMTIVTLDDKIENIPRSGRVNYVVVNGKHSTENATCYHFVNGSVWNHADAGEETVNGATVLKEDNQHVYLPFTDQLFTGYGWGVSYIPVGSFSGITVLDHTYPDSDGSSQPKFDYIGADSYVVGTTVKVGDLFSEKDGLVIPVKSDKVTVTVSPVGDNSTASAVVTNASEWKNGTVRFSGFGALRITITDYFYSTKVSKTVSIVEPSAQEKFELVFDNTDKYLYKVGNMNTVEVGKLFAALDGSTINASKLQVTVVSADDNIAVSGSFAPNPSNPSNWAAGTITFLGTGVALVTITDNDYCVPKQLYVEVVDAMNATAAMSATENNVVLLNDIGGGSITISEDYAFYGNGFQISYAGNKGHARSSPLSLGFITVKGGTLDNVKVVCDIFPKSFLFTSEFTNSNWKDEGEDYVVSAVKIEGDGVVSNSHIKGARNNILIGGGNAKVVNTVTECGSLANIHIHRSSSDYTVTLEDVTTIQYPNTVGGVNVYGFGVVVEDNEAVSNPAIKLAGDFTQYNWITADTSISNTYAKEAITAALKETQYQHSLDGKRAINLGIAVLNEQNIVIEDGRDNQSDVPYELKSVTMKIMMSSITGKVYSIVNGGNTENPINERFDPVADGFTSDMYVFNETALYVPQFKIDKTTLGGQYIENVEGCDEYCYYANGKVNLMFVSGDSREIDLKALASIVKYSNQNLGLAITVRDSSNQPLTVTNGKVIFSEAGDYTVTYSVTDSMIPNASGVYVENMSKVYDFEIPVTVTLKDASTPDAYFEFDSSKQVIYRSGNSNIVQFIPFLAGLKIYDYNGQEAYLRFDGDNVNDFKKIAKASIANNNTTAEGQGYHIVTIELVDGGKLVIDMDVRANSGSGTHSGSIKVRNDVIYVVNNGTTSGKGQTWKIYSYQFTGNNGVVINSGLVTFGTAGVDCSKATKPSSNFGTTVKATVSYDANGGNCGQTVGYATSASTSVTLPTPTRSGYIFAGWYTQASGGTRVGGAGNSYTPSANITLYAQWGKPCTVTYNANGGSCGTASAKYTGTALTLPTPTRDGYWFIGWYDAAEGGNKIGEAGATYNPNGDITLYAHWQEAVKYTVTYNANGGSCGTASATYQGTALTLPTPTRTGYKFRGWYTAASGGENVVSPYIPSANIALYAQWEQISYTITITKKDNATVTVDKTTAYYNDTVSVTVSFSQSYNKNLTVKDASDNTILSNSSAGTYTFTMPASNVTIEASSSGGCVTPDTLVTLADGTQKRVDQLTGKELLLVWNHETGRMESVPVAYIVNHDGEVSEREIIHLAFSDGKFIKIVGEHVFYDVTLGKYVALDTNASDYIGHKFLALSDNMNALSEVELVSVEKKIEFTEIYEVVSYKHLTCFTDGLLSTSAYLDKLLNVFEIDGETYSYNADKVANDIRTYGLYTYEDFKDIISEEAFELYNAAYLKIAVGKGYITWDDILALVDIYFDVEVDPIQPLV